MFDFLSNRLQKSLAKIKAKTTLHESDILEVSRTIKLSLLEADVNLKVVKDFINAIKQKAIGSKIVGQLNPSQQMIKIVQDELTTILGHQNKPINLNKPINVMMLIGLQGSGKTTTVAKLAKYFIQKNQSQNPLLVAVDIYRPAAIEQLKTLGKANNLKVFSLEKKDPRLIVEQALKYAKENNHDLIIIDTAGRLAINQELMQELIDLKKISKPNQIYLVVDALSGQDIINVADTFNQKLNLDGVILTKLDSDARGGAALSITHLLKIPIAFIGVGEKINNLDLFYPQRMAQRILGMGDVLSFIEKAQENIDQKDSEKMMNRLAHGKFDLNDLINQLKQIKKMGKMGKLLKLIPGLANKISPEKIASAEKKLVLFEILINSMTGKERKIPKLLKQNSRKQRIIKGSGRSAQEYNLLINEFDRMSKQMKEFSKSINDGTFNPSKMGF